MPDHPAPSRPFQFSLKTLLVGVTAIALFCAAWPPCVYVPAHWDAAEECIIDPYSYMPIRSFIAMVLLGLLCFSVTRRLLPAGNLPNCSSALTTEVPAGNDGAVRPGQFSLASMFIATAFIAAAAAMLKLVFTPRGSWAGWFLPILICGAIGAFRGRLGRWLWYGVAVDLALLLVFLLLFALLGGVR